ncbi:MAG TPA: carotenoid oxygenase family protein [Acidimicrobiales bacterium]
MDPLLVVDGVLPPDLQGTLLRIGPGGTSSEGGGSGPHGMLHAIELRDGTAISHLRQESPADANVLWHAGKVLALSESGLPHQYSRLLQPEEFGDGLKVPVASHLHRDSVTGGRVLFGVEPGTEESSALLRVGEWNSAGGLVSSGVLELERATWQHDLGVTARHLVVIESPTQWAADLAAPIGEPEPGSGFEESEFAAAAVPFRWVPSDETWLAVLPRGGDFSAPRWFKLDPCLVTHVLHAHDVEDEGGGGASGGSAGAGGESGDVVLYVCCYPAPERNQPFDWEAPVVGPDGIGQSFIGGGLGRLERWTIRGERLEREPLDERHVEYPRSDPLCEGRTFRYGYSVEQSTGLRSGVEVVDHVGLLRFDVLKDEVVAWQPGDHRTASEPVFVRSVEGHADDEGWLLTFVHDAALDTSALYVLDASSLRRRPQAVIHLPATVPFRSHSEWVGADRYR